MGFSNFLILRNDFFGKNHFWELILSIILSKEPKDKS
jgi:hypothetical protein